MLLSHKCMTATSLAPFLAPAAGTVAFLLLLCVTIGVIFTLTPLSANDKLTASGNDTQSLAWAGLPTATGIGIETEDSTIANERLAKSASPDKPQCLIREMHSGKPASRDIPPRLDRDLPTHPTQTPESYADSQSAVRWWGINE